mgnify:FL=1
MVREMAIINVTRSSMPSYEEYCDEIKELWESHWLTNMGIKHNTFKSELEKYMGVEHVELLTNGHMALELTMQALHLSSSSSRYCNNKGNRKEVITTPYTFISTTHAIVRNGLEPVFCDIEPENYTMDVSKIEKLINDNTVAIVPVHVYGNVCDVYAIEEIANKYGLKVIYDAAHSFGETYKGEKIGTFGDVSTFSFHATKVFNSIEGGAVCYKDADFGKNIYSLKNFGIKDEEHIAGVGANAKMNEFCAAMGLCNLRHVNEEIEKRKLVTECYMERLDGIPGIKLRNLQKDVESNYAYFPIVVEDKIFGKTRNEIKEALANNGIYARKYFYPLTNEAECFYGKYDIGNTPIAKHISRRVLTLPMYSELSKEDVTKICDIILE